MPPTQATFLDSVLVKLKEQMRPEQYDTWFQGLSLGQFSDEEVEYCVPTGFVRDWLNRYYLDAIRVATVAALTDAGEQERRVRISADSSLQVTGLDTPSGTAGTPPGGDTSVRAAVTEVIRDVHSAGAVPDPGDISVGGGFAHSSTGGGAVPHQDNHRLLGKSPLNKDYTFEQFVVGPSNQLSHSASLAVGRHPGRAYNPLFIHGNVGLGKTHLLQSICHAIRQRPQPARVVYLSCEEYTNRFILAIQSGKLDVFREHYRTADVLVIDDIQFLASKGKTQDEFFYTFNALYNAQKQIVISSDRPPTDIPTVEDRLVSRFKWGLVTDIQPPCFETRLAIVKRKALMRAVDLDDEVASYIADRIVTNIREVEGAVIKVIGVAAITERPISIELAKEALLGVTASRPNRISIPDIICLITSEFSVSARDLTGKSRTQKVSLPRQIGMFLAREYTDHSLEEVGRYFGNRDHTTVLYAVTKIKKRAKTDTMFRELLAKLSNRLESGNYQRSR